MTSHSAPATTTWVSVYDGHTCIGHILSRGPKGYEAFDVDDNSVGMFAKQADAANALEVVPEIAGDRGAA